MEQSLHSANTGGCSNRTLLHTSVAQIEVRKTVLFISACLFIMSCIFNVDNGVHADISSVDHSDTGMTQGDSSNPYC